MPLELSIKAELLKNQTNIEQQIILEIDGIPFIYGAIQVTKLALYGDDLVYGHSGLVYGGITVDPTGRAYISLQGTTRNITQQLEITKGNVGSIMKFNVTLIDKNQEVTNAFTPGVFVDDILSREANVYIAFQGGAHPRDSIRIFNGIVTGQEASPGAWRLSIDHPEFLKRQDIFQQVTTNLSGAISSGATSIVLDSIASLITPQDAVESYIRIEDELIKFTTITEATKTLSGITRGSLNTIASAHDDESDAVSFYTLTGDAIDLALKLMLSNNGNIAFKENVSATRFVQVDALTQITNGVFFIDGQTKDNLGLEIGDLVTITGASIPANNFNDGVIAGFVTIATGLVIVITGPTMVVEINSSAVVSFKSRFNTLPDGAGCGMKPSQVDIAQHLRMKTLFPSLPEYLFYMKDTVVAKDFLTEQVYFPAGFYQSPRKARASVTATLPPLVLDELAELTDSNVKRADNNKIKRQITKNFFNNVVYKFNRDALTDRFLAGNINFSQRSVNRIKTGNKTLKIESDGFRGDAATRSYIESQAKRFSDRFQFAAESIKVKTNYKTGMTIENSDIVLFGNSNLKLPDVTNGTRDFAPRLMEVTNKKLDIRGDVELELLDTGFGLDGRFGVISPNSFIADGSTTTQLVLKPSFGTGELQLERSKWDNLVGEFIRVRNQDFTFQEVVKLVQFDPGSLNRIIISPALSITPPADYLIDLPDYPDDSNAENMRKMKAIHCFFNPQVNILSAANDTSFVVAPADIDKFLVDAFVIIHNDDYSNSSTIGTNDDDLQIISVDTGTNTVTTTSTIGFVPLIGDKVDLIGFKDAGLPFRLV